ncbi:hypothetical protein N1851_031116 [Merluccius polli]|uniref:Uncharacterized protein n=1 Tax=Merluccius polli TaxID=89951 RepID=A0AA47M4B6_MERPO|nr:hypothetical protein N1851_031116 [Merluccius polli]
MTRPPTLLFTGAAGRPAEMSSNTELMFFINGKKQTISLYQQLTEVCAKGGFRLNKWVCNERTVLSQIQEENRAKGVKTLDLSRDQLPMERALGVQWDVEGDIFTFSITNKHKPLTRCGILSTFSSFSHELQEKETVLSNYTDLAAEQSKQISILSATIQDTILWDPTCPRPAASSTPNAPWTKVLLRNRKSRPGRCSSPPRLNLANKYSILAEVNPQADQAGAPEGLPQHITRMDNKTATAPSRPQPE